MRSAARAGLVVGPGLGVGFGAFAVAAFVLWLISPPQAAYPVETALSVVFLLFAFLALGIWVAGYVEEARRSGPRVPVWLGAATAGLFVVTVLMGCAAASLFGILPLTMVRVILVLGIAGALGALGAVFLVDRLQADQRREREATVSGGAVIGGSSALEEAAADSQLTREERLRLDRILERQRAAIEPMSHILTPEDPSLAASIATLMERLRASTSAEGAPEALQKALRVVESSQERRIASQVKRG